LKKLSISSRFRELPGAGSWSGHTVQLLWSTEAKAGATEGRKDRPCAIVVAVPAVDTGDTRVVVVPVTHSAPQDPAASFEVPHAVGVALGLGEARSWVRLDELHVFAWPGYDLRAVQGTDRIEYGPLPQPLFEQIRRGVIALDRSRRTQRVTRD
jgi:hypothetical protein